MPNRYGTRDPGHYRLRLVFASLVSLAIHALILSLEFGIPGFGLPGLQAPWSERRAYDEGLHIELADTGKPASAVHESTVNDVPAAQSGNPGSAAPSTPNISPPAKAVEDQPPLQPRRGSAPSSLAILPPQQESSRTAADAASPALSAPGAAKRAKPSKPHKPKPKAGRQAQRNTALAEKNTRRASRTKSSPQVIAQAKPDTDSFAVPPVPDAASTKTFGSEVPDMQEIPEDAQPAALVADAIEDIDAVPSEPERQAEAELEPAQNDMPPLAQAAVPDERQEPLAEQVTEKETHTDANPMQQQDDSNLRQAEQLEAQLQAEENEARLALEQQRQQRADEEARQRLQEEEERQSREAQQLAAREREEEVRRAEMAAQRQAELEASQLAAQRLEEETRRKQALEAQLKAEEDARRVLAAEEQRRAELAAQEQAAQQMRAEAAQKANQLAMQEQAIAAQRAQQAALDAQERAQALAAQSQLPGQASIAQGGVDQAAQSASRSSGGASGMPANAGGGRGGGGAESRSGTQERAGSQAAAPAAAASKADDPADQGDDGPIMLTDAQLDSVKVAQIRTIDKTRLDTWEVRELEHTQSARRRTLFGRAHDDIVLKMYIDDWEKRIEKSAAETQQPETKAAAPPLVTVSVRSDGSVENIAIDRSGSQPELDQAIREIVGRAAQTAFPRDLARRYDVIEIRRVWDFSSRLRLLEAAP
ncbi:MAG: hypothetical protein ACO1NO_11535 [Burkholderiaceae bacterium]